MTKSRRTLKCFKGLQATNREKSFQQAVQSTEYVNNTFSKVYMTGETTSPSSQITVAVKQIKEIIGVIRSQCVNAEEIRE